MRTLGENLNELEKQKKRLVNSLVSEGTLASTTEPLENLITKSEKKEGSRALNIKCGAEPTYFIIQDSSTKTNLNIQVSGEGELFIIQNDVPKVYSLSKELMEIQVPISAENSEKKFFITIAGYIEVLDLHDNDIQSFYLGQLEKINKLLVYNNKIDEFLCSPKATVQSIHIFSNPICNEDDYIQNLYALFESLPDRSTQRLGSIVTYKWYGLEKLVYKDGNTYKKYPSSYTGQPFTLEENRLYGVVSSDEANISYHICYNVDGTLILEEYAELNRHHTNRKFLEQEYAIKKNWFFGSAILYDDIAKNEFPYFLQDTGVHEVWESAEKGFGLCFCTGDFHNGHAWKWEDMNIKNYVDFKGNVLSQSDVGDYKTESQPYHGDVVLSFLVGRGGEGFSYGACPNASIYPIDIRGGQSLIYNSSIYGNAAIKYALDVSHIGSFSFAGTQKQDSEIYYKRLRKTFGDFGAKSPLFCSACNGGGVFDWSYTPIQAGTEKDKEDFSWAFGNFSSLDHTSITAATVENQKSNVFVVESLTPSQARSRFSENSAEISGNYFTGFTPEEDYITYYGEYFVNKPEISTDEKTIIYKSIYAQGTSYSAPACASIFGLMQILYKKINPSCNSFGKNSLFMDYVRTNWLDPLPKLMSFCVGMGMPSFLAEKTNKLTTNTRTKPEEQEYFIVGEIGKPIVFSFPEEENVKSGYTFDVDARYLARTEKNELIPLTFSPDGDGIMVSGYSNASFKTELDKNYGKKIQVAEPYSKIKLLINQNESLESMDDITFFSKPINPLEKDEEFVYPDSTKFLEDQNTFTLQFVVDMAKVIENRKNYASSSGTVKYSRTDLLDINLNDEENVNLTINYQPKQEDEEEYIVGQERFHWAGALEKVIGNNSRGPSSWHFSETDKLVITMAFDKTSQALYCNGTQVFCIPCEARIPIYLDNVKIYKNILADNGDVLFYDKRLSQKEIIFNTIALLSKVNN